MSAEDVELVKEAFRRFNAGDWDGMAELYAPDATGVGPEGWPEGRAEGREALIDQFRRVGGEGVESRTDIEETVERDRTVVVRFRWEVPGAATGLSQETRFSGVFRVVAGRIVDVRFFWDDDEALGAAGLSG